MKKTKIFLFALVALSTLLIGCKKDEEEKCCKKVLWALAIIGAVAAVAAIAYAVYCFLTPDCLEDFEEDFEDDFDDEYFEDEEDAVVVEEPVDTVVTEETPIDEASVEE